MSINYLRNERGSANSLPWVSLCKYYFPSYREITGTKRTIVHGHGYMAKYPTRAELMDAQIEQARATAAEQEKNKHLEVEVQRLREQLVNEVVATDRKVEEVRRQIQEEEDIKREKLRENSSKTWLKCSWNKQKHQHKW
jgi:regulator of replication initiation timing